MSKLTPKEKRLFQLAFKAWATISIGLLVIPFAFSEYSLWAGLGGIVALCLLTMLDGHLERKYQEEMKKYDDND